MPNHIHGIIVLNYNIYNKNNVGTGSEPVPTNMAINKKHHGLSEITRQFKTFSSQRINRKRKAIGKPLWQRSFYDYIIRNEKSLNNIREYIRNNPLKWETDKNNPININKKHYG
jgi:REP element-mobilizing transposase RayT